MKEKKLIAFDLYDTCLEFSVPHIAYDEIFSVLNDPDIKRSLKRQILTSLESIEDILSTRLPEREIDKYLAAYYYNVRNEVRSVQLFPETKMVLDELHHRGYKIATISNVATPYTEPLYKLLPHTFDYEILSCDVGMKKPDKEIFECLETLSGYHPDDIVMAGDSMASDVQGAKNAGIDPIHVNRKSSGIIQHPDYISIPSLKELLDLFH